MIAAIEDYFAKGQRRLHAPDHSARGWTAVQKDLRRVFRNMDLAGKSAADLQVLSSLDWQI